jgi:protein TonB
MAAHQSAEKGRRVLSRNLGIFLSISMSVHLCTSIVLMQIPDLKIKNLPNLNLEIFLLRVIAEEKSPPKIISPELKMEFKEQENLLSHTEKKEETPSPIGSEPGSHLPTLSEEPKPISKREEGEKSKKESEPIPMSPTSTTIVLAAESSPSLEKLESALSLKATPVASTSYTKDFHGNSLPENDRREKLENVSKLPPSGGEIAFAQPKYAENPKPPYPREARERGYQGEVVLRVEVLANGQVGQVEVKKSSGYELLDRSALAAVKQWRFIPAKKGDEAVALWVNIPIKFQLQ